MRITVRYEGATQPAGDGYTNECVARHDVESYVLDEDALRIVPANVMDGRVIRYPLARVISVTEER